MAIAEIEPEGVVSDLLPAEDLDLREIVFLTPAVLLTKDIALSSGFCARRCGAEFRCWNVRFRAVTPDQREFRANDLDLLGCIQKEIEPRPPCAIEKRKMREALNQ